MPLVDLPTLLSDAKQSGYIVSGFTMNSLDVLDGVVRAAERSQSPLLLSISPFTMRQYSGELLLHAAVRACQNSSVPVALEFLNEEASVDEAVVAINGGCNTIALSTGGREREEALTQAVAVTTVAHRCGVSTTVNIGLLPYIDTREGGQERQQAAEQAVIRFAAESGIDTLLFSAMMHDPDQPQAIDLGCLRRMGEQSALPLQIDNGSELSEVQCRDVAAIGVALIRDAEVLADAEATVLRDDPKRASRGGARLSAAIQDTVMTVAERYMHRWGSAGYATRALAAATPWRPVEHVIIYNTEGLAAAGVEQMMAEGRRVLSQIPGVLEVVTGSAVESQAGYRHCWLVRFCHPAVIESYRDHPLHLQFANELFRPVAGNRISIDYARTG